MGTDKKWNPTERPNILLIGNSIVMGGNPYDQKDKLGTLIQEQVGNRYNVWPIAAGGWTNVNETVYLKRNADVGQATYFFLWEYMIGGLSARSTWLGEYVFPKEHPIWGSWYVLQRYVLPELLGVNMSGLPPKPTGTLNATYLADFKAAVATLNKAASSKGHGLLFLYPQRVDYITASQGKEWLPERAEVERIAHENGLAILDISRARDWNESLYRSDNVHPTVQGNVVLAKILAAAIKDENTQHPVISGAQAVRGDQVAKTAPNAYAPRSLEKSGMEDREKNNSVAR